MDRGPGDGRNRTDPWGLPVLARGAHRHPGQGACLMEYTAHLVGAPFNDRPRCTHPAMATLARQVNDRISNVTRQELITRVPAPTRRRAGASRRGSGGRQGELPARAGGRPIGTEDPSGRPITHARRAGAQLVGPAAGRGLHPSADRRRAVIPHPERPRPRAPGPVPARGAGARVVRVRGDRSGGRRERDDARDERIRPGDLTRARGLQDRRPRRPHPSPTPRARWRNPCSRPRRWAW